MPKPQIVFLPLCICSIQDSFGESGTPGELMKKYGLEASNIVDAAMKVIARK